GVLPIRQGCLGDVPADATGGDDCDWKGLIPYDDLPHLFNPPSGIIVTANQNPFPKDYRYPVAGVFPPPDRATQIRALLEARSQWRPEEMLGIQKDVYSAFSHFLATETVKAWDKQPNTSPQMREAV